MGEVADLKNAYNWNTTKIGKAFGLHRDTVRRKLQDAGVEPVAKQANAPLYALEDVGPALFGSIVQSDPDIDPSRMHPKDRKDWYQSENERLKFEKDQRHLVPDDEVAREFAILVKAVANGLDSLPDELERECGLSPEALEMVQSKIDAMRETIYGEAAE